MLNEVKDVFVKLVNQSHIFSPIYRSFTTHTQVLQAPFLYNFVTKACDIRIL